MEVSKNFKIHVLSFAELIDMHPKLWKGQRDLDEDKVRELQNMLLETYNDYGTLDMFNLIHLVEINDEYVIIDGQHRHQALMGLVKFKQIAPDFNVGISVIKCENHTEIEDKMLKLNSITPQTSIYMSQLTRKVNAPQNMSNQIVEKISDDEIIMGAMSQLSSKYKNFNKKKRRPNVHVDCIADKIKSHGIVDLHGIKTADELCGYFVDLNNFYCRKSCTYFQKIFKSIDPNHSTDCKRLKSYYDDVTANKNTSYHMLGLFKTHFTHDKKSVAHNYSLKWLSSLTKIIKSAKTF